MLFFCMRSHIEISYEVNPSNACNPRDIESETAVILRSRAYRIQNKYSPEGILVQSYLATVMYRPF